ncbi:HK97 family phage prohead protease [Myroides sp. 1354]|uniref:HK97 family phage prohead protease n=1 Tax=unclassified Myroides TaxID=2642485 RepID=UPI0025762065|nr:MULTISPECIES: HK97 family phage prohead protease [unclassified Myroides]MDM1045879.1 HK97 family phage prohead protease [Myroides sp. R163-1]MDM1056889.1 HK97 family phage prohead protease [Myroides sp. 1354]MDM1070084.1 HK97 family phage prohead protease [Myroides sp. 1372]
MSKKINRFVVNDQEQKNSYGFYVLTSGISLVRFEKNPVMLDGHFVSNHAVIGKWLNIQKENNLLTMLPEFDTADEVSNKIAGKVERGFIKGCSMGIIWHPDDLEWIGDKLVLTKCELYEVSIVAVPSNQNTIHLYNSELQLLKDDEVQAQLSLIPTEFENETDNMKKIVLSLAVLQALSIEEAPTEGVDANIIEAKVLGLSNQLTAVTAQLKAFKDKEAQEAQAAKLALIDQAEKAGKIKKEQRETFLGLDYDIAKNILDGIPGSTSLAAQIQNKGIPDAVGMTDEKFQTLSLDEQLAFKANHPDAYQKMFKTK